MATAALARREETMRRGVTINLRVQATVKELIDRAAQVVGKTRSEFMLDSARKCAEDVLLDQRLFMLDEERYAAFMNLLSEPPMPSAELKKLLASKSPWEK